MKILLITESCPFPPANGKELPIAKIFEKLSKSHQIDLLICDKKENKKESIQNSKDAGINKISFIGKKRLRKKKRILNAILKLDFASMQPFIFNSKEIDDALGDAIYDWVWVSPISSFALIHSTNKKFYRHLALGLNDVKTYLYRDSLNEVLKSRIWDSSKIFHYLRSFSMKSQERRILALCDLIHVQTVREKSKAEKLLSPKGIIKPTIISSPNGINPRFCDSSYKGIETQSILLITQMQKGRKNESEWFIKKVWPLVLANYPEAKLHLVGKLPEKLPKFIETASNVQMEGFVPSLMEFSENMSISVVPTFHGTGLINRILDSFCYSLPVVTTPEAAATFHDIEIDKHLFVSDHPKEFASKIIELLSNRELRLKLSREGNEYARRFPEWSHGAKTIEESMMEIMKLEKEYV